MVSVTVYAVAATYYDVRQWKQKGHGNEPAVFVRPWTVDQPLTSLLHRTTDPPPILGCRSWEIFPHHNADCSFLLYTGCHDSFSWFCNAKAANVVCGRVICGRRGGQDLYG